MINAILQSSFKIRTIARRNVPTKQSLKKIATAFGLAMVIYLFIVPNLASAKTLLFFDKTWEVLPFPSGTVNLLPIRNDLDLTMLAKQAILGREELAQTWLLDEISIKQLDDISSQVNQVGQDAKLVMDGNRAAEFNPGQNGQALDLYTLKILLRSDQAEISLPVLISEPAVKLSDTNRLGINELVAVGESDFAGSPKNRIHNLTVGANKFNGLIIEPGEVFSFNKYLGDVDGEHGFLPELVIKAGGVTPEFGGGLCQVSSTTFRAAMNAGLPITARRNHSFAVQYYAPQGTDATIYPGAVDLKFVNNLPSKLLIQTKIVGTKLYFNLYATKDNRTVSFEGPTQYDQKPDGSMKAIWTRHVTLNGQTTDQEFKSAYSPPALYHRDSSEQSATPNPDAQPDPQPTT
ncbi:MAG: hypothetical protein A2660_02935 [Candidatus Doudnabacteria bacterium RIFCSPHIGHO2_01_FULL_45_18]|uniref:Peptidoglycan binding domain-containing protein n=1 Tax=Candidatus Doudnabacteria bacterium RIFCSPHIGHO2_01_FULL_45_18 TaxID=1817823 RepID=A0A1F5NR47_9BACT|nr:MAG: hypothetical protein A2660_02935 [Candidatus Doudnabacteria bacterium RIFCSPHIGHO2_01_FULL_45_18]